MIDKQNRYISVSEWTKDFQGWGREEREMAKNILICLHKPINCKKKCYWKPCGKNSYCRDFVQNTNTALFCLSIYLYYSGWSLANLVSLAYSSEWEVKICFLWAKKKLRQPSKGFWLSIIEHINFEICASKFCANLSKKLQNQNFFVGKLTIQLGMSDEQYGFT